MWLVVMTKTLVSGRDSGFSETAIHSRVTVQRRRACAWPGPRSNEARGHVSGRCRARNYVGEQPTIVVKVLLEVPRLTKPTSHATAVCPEGDQESKSVLRETDSHDWASARSASNAPMKPSNASLPSRSRYGGSSDSTVSMSAAAALSGSPG